MAKSFGPNLSIDAKGSIGKAITFQGRPKGTCVMKVPRHKDAKSASQLVIREYVAEAINMWRTLTPTEQAMWNGWK